MCHATVARRGATTASPIWPSRQPRASCYRARPKPPQAEIDAAQARARERVRPQFNSIRYGAAEYCQLAETCAEEIVRGASDESEMGVFHDLFLPQRTANLRARLEEHLPAGMQAGIIYAT